MTYLEAAYAILKQSGKPLHYKEITRRALEQGLIEPRGLTPEATMGSRLYTDTKQEGSRFVRAGRGLFGLAEWEPSGLEAQVADIRRRVRAELRRRLAHIPPDRFEALIADLLIQMGFDENTVQVTQRSSDGGIDVTGVFRATGITHLHTAVQVKRWKGSVGAKVVRELRGSLEAHQHGIIITTGTFTRAAREEAVAPGKKSITLIDGEALVNLLIKHRVGVVDRQVTVIDLDEEWWGEWEVASEQGKEEPPPTPRPTPKGRRVTGMRLLGEDYPANSWRSALIITCNVLASRYGEDFARRAVTLRGRKRPHVAPTPEGMTSPHRIPGTSLWVETNFNAKATQRLIHRLLALFGHPPDAVEIYTSE